MVLDVFARLVGLAGSLTDFVRLAGFSRGFDDARRRDWRDITVVSEHVVVDRTASLTESGMELVGRTVTAMSHVLGEQLACGHRTGRIEALRADIIKAQKTPD
jgi:hypothetical protein